MPELGEVEKAVSKTILKAAERYAQRMKRGELIMRDSAGRVQWADGKPVGEKSLQYMLAQGLARELDTDLFGDAHRGQTIGMAS
jgi:hypothetical protein